MPMWESEPPDTTAGDIEDDLLDEGQEEELDLDDLDLDPDELDDEDDDDF